MQSCIYSSMTTAALGTFTCSCEESTVYSSPLASGIFDRLLAATQFIKIVSRLKCKFSTLHMQSSIFWSLYSGFSKSWPFPLLVVVTCVWMTLIISESPKTHHTTGTDRGDCREETGKKARALCYAVLITFCCSSSFSFMNISLASFTFEFSCIIALTALIIATG